MNRWDPATLLPIRKTFYIYVHPSGASPILRVQNGMLKERVKQTTAVGLQFKPRFIPAVIFPSADPHSNFLPAFLVISASPHHSIEQPNIVPFSRLFVAPKNSLSSSCLLSFCSLFCHYNIAHENKNKIQQPLHQFQN